MPDDRWTNEELADRLEGLLAFMEDSGLVVDEDNAIEASARRLRRGRGEGRLRDDLERYGAHHDDCYYVGEGPPENAACNCGWTRVVEELDLDRDPTDPGPPLR